MKYLEIKGTVPRGVGSLILQLHLLRLPAHFSRVDVIGVIVAICAMSRVSSLRGAGTQT